MTDPVRIALVGAGGIAQRYHLPSLRALAQRGLVELAALVDVDAGKAERLAAQFGFERAYTNVQIMLAEVKPQAAWLLVPTSAMVEVAVCFLDRGVPILLEKPPAPTASETQRLAALAQAGGVPNQVAFNRRFAPLLVRQRELALRHGPPHTLSCQFYRHNRTEAIFPFSTGIHGLDTIRWLGASEVREVNVQPHGGSGRLVQLGFAGGGQATLEFLPDVGIQSERYTLHSGTATFVSDGAAPWLTAHPGYLEVYENGRLTHRETATGDPWEVGGFLGESEAFVESLRLGRPPQPSLAEAVRSMEIAELAQQTGHRTFDD